ncbi:MAG TPA: FkbM family methyltransferase [Rhizomicrobium sp.]|nr:FkbM family methyltransferase [Rhizomicrobium sp.]
MQAAQILRFFRSHWLRSRALAKAKRKPDADPSEDIAAPSIDGLMPLARTKLKAMADVMGCSEAEASLRILERTLASLPDRALPAYLLPSLAIARCERIGEELMQIELKDGHVFTGHRSNQKEFFLYQTLSQHLPAKIDGDAYKLALDIERRYYGIPFPWFIRRGGIYVEGGCFTGMKAVRWADLGKPQKILAVEMGSANFEILRTNIADNLLADIIRPVHAGLWSESGDGMQKHDFSTRRFLETTDDWKAQMRHDEPVRLLTLKDLLEESQVDVADYVNVQVNGAEIAVLEGAMDALDRIKVIDIAAYYSKNGVKNVEIVQKMLVDAGCTILQRSELGRITAVTPRFYEEVMALKEQRDRRRVRR